MNVVRNPASPRRYDVVVPVKRLDRAKTRLADLGDELRRELVLAFLGDVLDALAGCAEVARVAVVSDDDAVAALVAATGTSTGRDPRADDVLVVAEPSPGGINPALRLGVEALGSSAAGLLALCADLPAVTARDLSGLLGSAPQDGAAFVADRAGVGTTAYLVTERSRFDPAFGPRSRAEHLRRGARDLTDGVSPLLRCDVDTPADLTLLRGSWGIWTQHAVARHANSPLLS